LGQTFEIGKEALKNGLAHAATLTGLRGRWEVLRRDPLVVCDTAHNAHGLAEVAQQIAHQKYDKLYMVLGFAGDKDLDAIIPLLPSDAHYILTQASGPRAMPAEEIAIRLVESGKWKVESVLRDTDSALASLSTFNFQLSTIKTVAEAISHALFLATPGDMVYIGGSNFVVGEALPLFEC
jgi:dihydrofolate synthase/folylpolyglutamate synthase